MPAVYVFLLGVFAFSGVVSAQQSVDINPLNIKVDTHVPTAHHKTLADYTEQLALKLADVMAAEHTQHIAVSSFVDFNANLQTSHALGNQLAENLLTDLQLFGFSTVEPKLMPVIAVTKQGDFALSRNHKKLARQVGVEHIVTGTLIYRPNGVMVNARVINANTQGVKASARQFIPYFVLQ